MPTPLSVPRMPLPLPALVSFVLGLLALVFSSPQEKGGRMWLLLSMFMLASLRICKVFFTPRIQKTGTFPSSTLTQLQIELINSTTILNIYTHWYRQKPGQPPKGMLCINSRGNIIFEKGFSE